MRDLDKPVFSQAAMKFEAWILVRPWNEKSNDYMGLHRYVPKRVDCKAKTANFNDGKYQLAGLVVDPVRWRGAFAGDRRDDVLKNWKKFMDEHRPGQPDSNSPYDLDLDASSRHFGCVRLNGNYVFSDYDLKDIVLMKHPRGNIFAVGEKIHGAPNFRGPSANPVMDFINRQIGIPMVQHGGDAQFRTHENETIDAFGPSGEQESWDLCTTIRRYAEWKRWVPGDADYRS